MKESDRLLRNKTYGLFVSSGRAPSATDMAMVIGSDVARVVEGWQRLHDAHALVLEAGTHQLRMLNPFSTAPTAYRVQAAGRWWYANCAWDAFGICAALSVDGRIESSCPDCAVPLAVTVADKQPDDLDLLFHCLLPAAQWWDDIVFT